MGSMKIDTYGQGQSQDHELGFNNDNVSVNGFVCKETELENWHCR
jgi:hypothetical protein